MNKMFKVRLFFLLMYILYGKLIEIVLGFNLNFIFENIFVFFFMYREDGKIVY